MSAVLQRSQISAAVIAVIAGIFVMGSTIARAAETSVTLSGDQ
jgi:hypothetical protein